MHILAAWISALSVALIPVVLLAVAGCKVQSLPPEAKAGPKPAMVKVWPDSGFELRVLFTVGDQLGDYQPPGKLDGLGAWRFNDGTVRILANHEFGASKAYPFRLANGTELRGSRISFFDLNRRTLEIEEAGLAFDSIRDRRGREVTSAAQVSERTDVDKAGLNALCSAAAYTAGDAGFVDDIFFTNEEVSAREDHPHGGSVWALDVAERRLWALPDLGRGSWENVTALDAPPGYVALLLGDDIEFGRAPLYLYLGRKDPAGDFLARNGLRGGRLFVWVADSGDLSPADWHGTGSRRDGQFLPLAARDPARAGERGHDVDGYLNDTALRKRAWALGAFRFSRPEDLHANPANGNQAVFASTGHGRLFPEDDWGTLYLVDVRFVSAANAWPRATASLAILHDADDFGDVGIRSADNLTWARDGMVYVQEDKATKRARFGGESGIEASVWRIDPARPADYQRIAVIDRSVRVPAGVRDTKAGRLGAWETSGIVDISDQIGVPSPGLALLLTVQAHGLRGGPVGRQALGEGGQLVLLTRDWRRVPASP
ncbi:MAG: DUF839 domain-containing protein [Chromatiales bacterium]|nr:MAG: DUF839 domain-containing protein [Chromatiales bacterium]